MRSRSARLAAIALVHLAICSGPANAADPKVPPGRDPGGLAVAVIGGGLDYRRTDIAARLARDGEGELVGWDFVDGDRHPFVEAGGSDALAAALVVASPARIVPVRVAAGSEPQIVEALRLLDKTPTRIVVLAAAGAAIARGNLVLASRQLGRMLIVAPARTVVADPAPSSSTDDAIGLLVVAAASGRGQEVDLIVEGGPPSGAGPASPTAEAAHPDDLAAARVAALAVRLATPDPPPTGAALRARILALAQPSANGAKALSGIDRLP